MNLLPRTTPSLIWFGISVVIAVAATFNLFTWWLFLCGAVAVACMVYLLGQLFLTAMRAATNHKYKKAFGAGSLTIGLGVVTVIVVLLLNATALYTGLPIPYLITNIFTGACSLNPSSDMADAWYYRSGCDVSSEEKIALIKSDARYGYVERQCEQLLTHQNKQLQQRLTWDEVTCADLIREGFVE